MREKCTNNKARALEVEEEKNEEQEEVDKAKRTAAEAREGVENGVRQNM